MKKFALSAVALTVMAGAAHAQQTLAHWNFNNTTADANLSWSDGNTGGRTNFGHMTDLNSFNDGYWDPTTDRLYPISSSAGGGPGALVGPGAIDSPVASTPAASNYGAWIDVSNLAGNNDDSQNNNWLSFSGTTLNQQFGSFAGGSLSITGEANNASTFAIIADLTSWQDIEVSWAQRGTGSGYTSRIVEVSTDGVNFTQIYSNFGALGSSWTLQTADAGALLDGASNAIIRWTIDGASSSNGNNRFDNIVLTGTLIPAPGAVALAGLAGLAGLRRRRA